MHLIRHRRGKPLPLAHFRYPTRRRLARSQARRARPICLQPPIAPPRRRPSALGPLATVLLLTGLVWGALGWLAPHLGIR